MFQGSQLSLFLGPMVTSPAPQRLLENLKSVTVTLNDTGRSGFQITLAVGRDRTLGDRGFPALMQQWVRIGNRVQIVATVNGRSRVLMDGVITTHQHSPSADPGQSTLTVTGEDLTAMLDLHEVKLPFPAMSEWMIAGLLLAGLAPFGVIPTVIPHPSDAPAIPTSEVPHKNGTFKGILDAMAGNWGYVSYWAPGPTRGTSFAYWGPPIRAGIPQRALTLGMGGESTVRSLSFTDDGTKPKAVYGLIQESETNAPIPVVGLPYLGPPLAAVPSLVGNVPFVGSKRLSQDPGGKVFKAFSQATAAFYNTLKDSSTADGELDTATYGDVLSARGLVDVRGVGWTHDGLWYVKTVTHTLSPGSWTQRFKLEREGTGPLLPQVMTA